LPEPPHADAVAREKWRVEHWGTSRFDHDSWRLEHRDVGHAHLCGLIRSIGPQKIIETLAESHPELRIWFLTDTPDWEIASRECFQDGQSVYFFAPGEGEYDAWFAREDALGLEA
jgi:hypothetical protein